MKNRIIKLLLLLSATALVSIPCVAPVMGQKDIKQTDVAAQEETTNLTAGITKVMMEHTHELSVDSEEYTGYLTSNINVTHIQICKIPKL